MTKMTKEERASRAEEACYKDRESKGVWDWVVQQQDRREGLLVAAARDAMARMSSTRTYNGGAWGVLREALAQYEALDAKPEPTLAECEKRLRDLWAVAQSNRIDGPLSDALDAWKAAVEREEDKR